MSCVYHLCVRVCVCVCVCACVCRDTECVYVFAMFSNATYITSKRVTANLKKRVDTQRTSIRNGSFNGLNSRQTACRAITVPNACPLHISNIFNTYPHKVVLSIYSSTFIIITLDTVHCAILAVANVFRNEAAMHH